MKPDARQLESDRRDRVRLHSLRDPVRLPLLPRI